jgi:hypothetical protein
MSATQSKVSQMRTEIEQIVDNHLRFPLGINRDAFVRDLLEHAVLTRGDAIIQFKEDLEKTRAMEKKLK